MSYSILSNQPLTPRAKRIFARACKHATDNGHGYVGAEHLLLSVFEEPDGVVPAILDAAGFNKKELTEKITKATIKAWATPADKTPDLKALADMMRKLADLID